MALSEPGGELPVDPEPRIPPLTRDNMTAEAAAFLDRWTDGVFKNADAVPPLMTFAHHPLLADLFSQFNIHLLTTSTLPVKERQIAIMRTAWVTKTTYMWSSHLNTSVLFGLDPEIYAPIRAGASDPYFSDFEKQIICGVDQLVSCQELDEATWTALSEVWNYPQMLDFLFTVGAYVMVAGVMKSIRIQRQDDLKILANKYGAP